MGFLFIFLVLVWPLEYFSRVRLLLCYVISLCLRFFFFENLYANFYSSFAILYIPNTNFSTSFQKERESE